MHKALVAKNAVVGLDVRPVPARLAVGAGRAVRLCLRHAARQAIGARADHRLGSPLNFQAVAVGAAAAEGHRLPGVAAAGEEGIVARPRHGALAQPRTSEQTVGRLRAVAHARVVLEGVPVLRVVQILARV